MGPTRASSFQSSSPLLTALIGWLLLNTSWKETRDVLIATAVGALLYLIGRAVQRSRQDRPATA